MWWMVSSTFAKNVLRLDPFNCRAWLPLMYSPDCGTGATGLCVSVPQMAQ